MSQSSQSVSPMETSPKMRRKGRAKKLAQLETTSTAEEQLTAAPEADSPIESNVLTNQSDTDSDDEPLARMVEKRAHASSLTSEEPTAKKDKIDEKTEAEGDDMNGDTTTMRPLTAFAHFFNDTQQSIRSKNQAATFEEVSRIVNAMWESLDANSKLEYANREDQSKKDFEKSVHEYLPAALKEVNNENTPENVEPELADKPNEARPALATDATQVSTTADSQCVSLLNKSAALSQANIVQSPSPKVLTLNTQEQIVVKTSTNQQGKPQMVIGHMAQPVGPLVHTSTIQPPQGIILQSGEQTNLAVATSNQQIIVNQGGNRSIHKIVVVTSKQAQSLSAGAQVTIVHPQGNTVIPSFQPGVRDQTTSPKTVHQVTIVKNIEPVQPSVVQPLVSAEPIQQKKCSRENCINLAVKHPKWNEDYCSSQCVVDHCSGVFKSWVAARNPVSA